jgi:hypothetical protein
VDPILYGKRHPSDKELYSGQNRYSDKEEEKWGLFLSKLFITRVLVDTNYIRPNSIKRWGVREALY